MNIPINRESGDNITSNLLPNMTVSTDSNSNLISCPFQVLIFKGINFKVETSTFLWVQQNYSFRLVGVQVIVTSFSGSGTAPIISLGTISPTYSDIYGQNTVNISTNAVNISNMPVTLGNIIQIGSAVYFNVAQQSSATQFIADLYISGYNV